MLNFSFRLMISGQHRLVRERKYQSGKPGLSNGPWN